MLNRKMKCCDVLLHNDFFFFFLITITSTKMASMYEIIKLQSMYYKKEKKMPTGIKDSKIFIKKEKSII